MKEAFEKIRKWIDEITEPIRPVGWSRKIEVVETKAVMDILSEVEAEYINKSTEHINKSSDCSSGWIPCSEKMPEEGVCVLVWYEYYRYGEYNRLFRTHGISYTFEGKWSGFVNGSSGWRELRIIAWMPLPEPYRADNEAELPFSDTEESEVGE